MQLNAINNINGTILLLSGLHIGAGQEQLEIGGLDQPIIKHPVSGVPYIPGSSIKGKMRSLLETYYFVERPSTHKHVIGNGTACGCSEPDCPSCRIFGTSGAEKKEGIGPTRIIVRDAQMSSGDMEQFCQGKLDTEVKYENSINRVSGTAAYPRPLERIPAGVRFDFSIAFKRFEQDEEDLINYVYKGLKLIQLDALGGNSSRGSGHVAFENVLCDNQAVDLDAIDLA
jgi:CRISPR-associated protein Csm3